MAVPVENHVFNGGLNSDDSDFFLGKGDYRNGINVRARSTDNGKQGSIQNVSGNSLVGTKLPDITGATGEYHTLGSYEDESLGCIYDLVYNSDGHHLLMKRDNDGSTVLMKDDDWQKNGIDKGLDLSRTELITSMGKVGDMLFWANGIPRRINVKRLESGQYAPSWDDDILSVIRRPPNFPPSVARIMQDTDSDLLKDHAFQFAWRFTYYDGEQSVFSPYSTLVNYQTETDATNAINILLPSMDVVKQDVRFVELAARSGNTGKFFVVKRWDKDNSADAEEIDSHNQGGNLSYLFFNDSIGEAVDAAQGAKLSDTVPLTSESYCPADNRNFFGNNVLGYDTPGAVDLTLSSSTSEVNVQGQTIYGSWAKVQEVYHSGLTSVHHKTAFMVYISGYDGIKDGYYAIKGVEGSESYVRTDDPVPDSWFSYPNPVNYADISGSQYIGTTVSDMKAFYGLTSSGSHKVLGPDWISHSNTVIVGAPTSNNFVPVRVFKTNSTYRIGIVYYDRYLRSSAVVSLADAKISTPESNFDNQTYVDTITWNLANTNAKANIPAWAEYYAVVMTNSLRTRFFMQTYPYEVSYVEKDDDGTYVTKKEAYDPTFAGIAIDITSLSKDNLGYVYNKGDVVNIYLETEVNGSKKLSLPVIDQYGKYIVVSLADLGDLTNTVDCLMELYTPYVAQGAEIYYEIGQMYAVTDPGLDTRTYSTLMGYIYGDTWIVSRKFSSVSANGVEAMNPNDKHYSEWLTNIGRPNILPQPGIGQAQKDTNIVFSDQYIPQTLVNGLSSFSATNTKDIPDSCGAIRKLVYTSKVEGQQGGVMLAICENETVAIYIGETRVTTQTGDDFLAAYPGVIGTVNVLKGSYGTINPESVVEKDGHVFFLCRKRGKVIQYAVNGLYPVSDYKMQNFFEQRCRAMDSLTADQLTAFGYPALFCPGGYDNANGEYLVSMPRVLALPSFLTDVIRSTTKFTLNFVSETEMSTDNTILSPKQFYGGTVTSDTLPATITLSYGDQVLIDNATLTEGSLTIPNFRPKVSGGKFTATSTAGTLTLTINQLQPNYHEADFGQEMVMAYKPDVNRWTTKMWFEPENMVNIGKDLFSFRDGNLYIHGSEAYNTFYGEAFPTVLAFVANEDSAKPRVYNAIRVSATDKPDYVHVRTEVPWSGGVYAQSTDLYRDEFVAQEGIFKKSLWFDRLSPNVPGAPEDKMRKGDKIRAQTAMILVEYDVYDKPVDITTVGISYMPSVGHVV